MENTLLTASNVFHINKDWALRHEADSPLTVLKAGLLAQKQPMSMALALTSSMVSKVWEKSDLPWYLHSPWVCVDHLGPRSKTPHLGYNLYALSVCLTVFATSMGMPKQNPWILSKTLEVSWIPEEQRAINKCLLTFILCGWELFKLLSEFFLRESPYPLLSVSWLPC